MLTALTAALGLVSAPAEPQPLSPTEIPPADYALSWSAPEGCPDRATIESRIAALTEGRPDGEGTLEVEGTVTAREDGYVLRLSTSLRGMSGARELSARACDDLAESAALVVAVTLDPALSGASAEPEPAEPDEEVPEPEPEPESSVVASESAVESELVGEPTAETWPSDRVEAGRTLPRPGLLLRTGLGPELGALPGATAAVRVTMGLHWPRVRVLLAGTYLTPRRADGPGGSAALYQQGMVAALGCARVGDGPWSLPVCGGVEAGFLRADGRALATPRTVTGPWVGPVARVGVLRSLGRVGLWLELEGVARIVGTRVVVDQMLAFRPSVGSLRALAGFEIAWR